MILFIYENSGRFQEAWDLLSERIKASPSTLRLYFTALDMMRRYPVLRKELPQLTEKFLVNASKPGQLIAFAEALLANFPEDITAIEAVAKIVSGKKSFSALPPMEAAQYHLVCARLCYLCCDVKKAEKHTQNALEIYRSHRYTPGVSRVEKMVEFYHEIGKLNTGNL
jgi:tetratricopeptide (TPR) repeat protein